MIKLENGFLIEDVSEFPVVSRITNLYLDFETTSGDPNENSLNTWKNCEILGVAVCWDDSPAYYLPCRHACSSADKKRNLPIEQVHKVLDYLLKISHRWINHNVKYDMHVARNSGKLKWFPPTICDTVVLAKLVHSDRFSYSLSNLSREILYKDIDGYSDLFRPYLYKPNGHVVNLDYGLIPLDYMAPYACSDVITERELYKKLLEELHPISSSIWETEKKLTPILFDIEQRGMSLKYEEAFKDTFEEIPKYLNELAELVNSKVGKYYRLHTSADCYTLFCEHFRLPVLEWTEKFKPSFGKVAMKGYATIPGPHQEIAKLVGEYRKLHKLKTGFTFPYCYLSDSSSRLHGSFNQCLVTGRLAMSTPNMQQLSKEAKQYIVPKPGHVLIDFDLKQIEYRVIAHYIENPALLHNYKTNPDVDYHDVMKELCQISRDAAKQMNFGVSFGAGKKKTKLMLKTAMTEDVIPEGMDFDSYCDKRGETIYNTYHENLPELKRTTKKVENMLRSRGWVKNLYGRVRTMPRRFAYKAFNNIVQSTAADFMKAVTTHIYGQLPENTQLVGIVHDSWVFESPKEDVDNTMICLQKLIEGTPHGLRVPIYCSGSYSEVNWRETDPKQEGKTWKNERIISERGTVAST